MIRRSLTCEKCGASQYAVGRVIEEAEREISYRWCRRCLDMFGPCATVAPPAAAHGENSPAKESPGPWGLTTWFSIDPFRDAGYENHPHGRVEVCAYDPRPWKDGQFHTDDYASPDNPMGVWGERERAERVKIHAS